MAKPSIVVNWPATGSIVEPPAGKKTAGWLPGEQPPAEFMNWLFNFLGQWSSYVDGLESTEALTWVLSQVFNKAITLGASFAASETEAVSPRLIAEPVSSAVADHTCVAKFKDARLWIKGLGSDSSFSLTVNATRTTAGADTWTKITASQPAFIFQVGRAGLSLGAMPAAQNTAWTDAFLEGEGTASGWGRLLFLNSTTSTQTDAEQDVTINNTIVNSTSTRKLLWTIKDTASGQPVRLYYVRSGGDAVSSVGFEITFNARWVNATALWAHDETLACRRYFFGIREFLVQFKSSAAAGTTFADTAFTTDAISVLLPNTVGGTTDHTKFGVANGHFAVTGTQTADADDANPPAKTAQANKVGCRNVDKVTAYFTTTGGADGNITPLSGYNLSTAADAVAQLADVLIVKFGSPLDSANYEAIVTVEISDTSAVYIPQLFNKAAGSISIRVFRTTIAGATSVFDLNTTTAIGINLRISGKQDT
jgi:hypothetical protein